MMGGGSTISGYGILLILAVIPGVQCDEDLTGVVVASVCAAILFLVLFVGLPIVYYLRHNRQNREHQQKRPKNIPNGNVYLQNGTPHYIKNGLPPPSSHRGFPPTSYRGMPPPIAMPPHGTWRQPFSRPIPVGTAGRSVPPPMMMHPYFYHQPYRQVIYIDDYEDEAPPSGRSTVRQHRERRESSSATSVSTYRYRELDSETDKNENTRAKTTTRSRSRSPPRVQEPPRPPSPVPEPAPENEDERIDEMFNFAADPQAGDVMFQHHDPNVRKPSEEDYTYSTVIKPASPVEQTSGWGAPDDDMRPAPSNHLRMSMSRKIEDIVQEGWGEHLIEMNEMETQEPEPVQMRKSVRPPTPELDIPTTPRTTYIRPPTPPMDIPQSPTAERPETPPLDYRVSKPPPPPVPKKDSIGRLSQSQAQNQTRGMFTNQVLEELRKRQKSVDDSAAGDDDDDDDRRAVTFSSQPPGIIPRSEPTSPRQSQTMESSVPLAGIPIPPPPPPLPPLPK